MLQSRYRLTLLSAMKSVAKIAARSTDEDKERQLAKIKQDHVL
jgi:hypothetical protein